MKTPKITKHEKPGVIYRVREGGRVMNSLFKSREKVDT